MSEFPTSSQSTYVIFSKIPYAAVNNFFLDLDKIGVFGLTTN